MTMNDHNYESDQYDRLVASYNLMAKDFEKFRFLTRKYIIDLIDDSDLTVVTNYQSYIDQLIGLGMDPLTRTVSISARCTVKASTTLELDMFDSRTASEVADEFDADFSRVLEAIELTFEGDDAEIDFGYIDVDYDTK